MTFPPLPGFTETPYYDKLVAWAAAVESQIEAAAETGSVVEALLPTRTQPAGTLVASPVDDGGRVAGWLSRERTRVFAIYRDILRYSDDSGSTWVDAHTFTHVITAVRDLDNGEVMVCTGSASATGKVFISSGWTADPTTATWTNTLTATTPLAFFSSSWSISVHQSIVLVNEYGPKAGGPTGNARYCYLSTDYGRTWRTIYDLGTAAGNHLHGVCYDPYWDRIWLTYGDDTSAIRYTDNLGTTWKTAQASTDPNGPYQAVGIVALPGCVLFASDGYPNGILRIDRSEGKHSGAYTIETAYQIDASGSLAWLGHQIFQARRPGGDAPVLFPFAPELSTGRSKVIATRDGRDFSVIWEDTADSTSKGALIALGPTARGDLWIVSNDGRYANYAKWIGPMPVGY